MIKAIEGKFLITAENRFLVCFLFDADLYGYSSQLIFLNFELKFLKLMITSLTELFLEILRSKNVTNCFIYNNYIITLVLLTCRQTRRLRVRVA